MEKKSFLGLLLILLILLLYPYYLQILAPKPKKISKTIEIKPVERQNFQDFEIKELKNDDTVHDTVIENNYLRITSSNQGAGIKMIQLIRLRNQPGEKFLTIYNSYNCGKNLFYFREPYLNFDLNNSLYKYEEEERGVRYTLTIPAQFRIEKIFSLEKDYLVKFTLRIKNLDKKPLPFNLSFLGGKNLKTQEPGEERFWEIAYPAEGKIKHDYFSKIRGSKVYLSPLGWLALKSKYFCQIIVPSTKNISFLGERDLQNQLEIYAQVPLFVLQPEEIKEENFFFYFGPLDMDILKEYNNRWKEIVYFGTFDSIAKIILSILKFASSLFKNYGVAIIFLSLFVNFLLFPFTWKSMKSMQALQQLQPKIEELRKQYSKDPQALNREILELYRKYKVNPFGGCLPLFFQMPIFISLYQVLSRAIELKGAKFLWIKDLSLPDALFTFSKKILFFDSFNLLPILIILGMYLQQKRTQTFSSSRQSPWFMPLFFGLIFYNFPSGLVLYWLISTFFNLLFQTRMLKK